MTQIYGARNKTKEKYCIKGIKEEKIQEINIKSFISYIEKTEMNKKRIGLMKKVASILWELIGDNIYVKTSNKEVRKLMEVKIYGRKMQNVYCKKYVGKNYVRIYEKKKRMGSKEYEKEYMDLRKIIQTHFVNSIHFIDSGICYEMIKRYMNKGQNILTIHDCFGVVEKLEETIEQNYINVLKEGEKDMRMENYYRNIVETKQKEMKGVRKKIEEEFENIVKESRERKIKIEVVKNSNLLKKG